MVEVLVLAVARIEGNVQIRLLRTPAMTARRESGMVAPATKFKLSALIVLKFSNIDSPVTDNLRQKD